MSNVKSGGQRDVGGNRSVGAPTRVCGPVVANS